MDSELGRFISEDNIPIDPNNPMTLNLYMYCSNNPVNRIDPSGHMDYLSQSDDLGAGIIDGIGDQIEGLKNAPEAIKTIAVAVIKGDITLDQLAEAGLEGVIGDYKYILENLSVFNPLQQNTDQEVYDMGKHVSGIVTDVALAATGVGAAKLFSVLSKTKSGAKVVKALKALSKSDEVVDGASDTTRAINNTLEDGIKTINGKKPINSKYANSTYELTGDLATKYPDGVKFNSQGFADFTPYSKAKVTVDGLTGNYTKDAALANKLLGLDKTPTGYVWHHVEDGKSMILVPQDIHSAVRHTGGAAVIKSGGI